MKYYIKVTCAFKWARKLPRKTGSLKGRRNFDIVLLIIDLTRSIF